MQTPEVRYQMLRPAQIVERRKACPIAYVPLGNLEWHGVHNPVGADTLQAEGLAIMCAQMGGGLAFPPLYYGENRLQALMESNETDRDGIAAGMELPPENFKAERSLFTQTEMALHYHTLLRHILAEVESLGFLVCVLVCGHYPLVDHARAAACEHNQWTQHARREYGREGMLAWACVDYLMVQEKYAVAGDHGGGWETSHVMSLHPQTVDLSLLPEKGVKLVGAGGKMAPQDATAEFGRQIFEDAAKVIIREAEHRLNNRDTYFRHGMGLAEGLWRKEQ
nr:creatininase family protein [bacterium]